MLKNRVIPCLLLQDHGLVKTCKFAKPKYVGDPVNAIRIFNDKEVDELIVLDIVASRNRTEPDYEMIEQFAEECFMPLCYGGGIATISQAKALFGLGVEKICIQSEALRDISLVTKIADLFGSQSVVVSIDVKRSLIGKPKLYSAARRQIVGKDWARHLQEVVNVGAGEVIINAVDRDGTMTGMDLDLIQLASSLVDTPIVAIGGAGSLEDIRQAVDAGASAVGVGAFFVFHGPHRAVLITYPNYSDLEKLLGVT